MKQIYRNIFALPFFFALTTTAFAGNHPLAPELDAVTSSSSSSSSSSMSSAPKPSTELLNGRYLIEGEPLNGGEANHIRKARDGKTGKQVVLKAPRLRDAYNIGEFEREITISNHIKAVPGVVPLLEWFTHTNESGEKTPIAVFEYCGKGDLFDLIVKGEISETFILSIFEQIITPMVFLHDNEIVHLDLKPENIFITETGDGERFLIGDFGTSQHSVGKPGEGILLARSCSDPTSGPEAYVLNEKLLALAAKKGTELSNSDGIHPRPADVFSAGATLYMMASGQPLFMAPVKGDVNYDFIFGGGDEKISAQLRILLEKTICRKEPLRQETINLMASMLATNPHARPTMADVLKTVKALRAGSSSSSTSTAPVIAEESKRSE